MPAKRAQLSLPDSGRRLLLDDIDWRTYSRLLRVFARKPSIRLTYDCRRLEIMSPLPEHESDADMLGRMVVVLTEELGWPIKAGGSSTFRRRREQRGLEPDNSYWITSEPKVRGKRKIDLKVDPPPDLAIEVDCTSSSLERMDIYAMLGVPEVWRLDKDSISFHILDENGAYVKADSRIFTRITRWGSARLFEHARKMDENAVIKQFRRWVQRRITEGMGG